MADFAAEYGTLSEGRELHSRQHRVDAVDHLAVGLVWSVETLEWLANQAEILGILERRILRDRLGACCVNQIAVAERASARCMIDRAVRRGATGWIDLPLLCSRPNEHDPRRGSRRAQRLPERANGIGVSSDLNPKDWIAIELVVRRRVLQHHFAEISIEFLGKDHGNRRVDALPHLDLRHHQGRLSGTIDPDEGVGCKLAPRVIGRLLRLVDCIRRKVEAEHKNTGQPALQNRTPRRRMRKMKRIHRRPPMSDRRLRRA